LQSGKTGLPDILRLEASRMIWTGKMAEFARQMQEANALCKGQSTAGSLRTANLGVALLAQSQHLDHKEA
jgi:hypothetical protein